MALNDVLNRPLFREQALRKGALKPVKARIGQFIMGPVTRNVTGQVTNPRNLPMVVDQPGFFSKAGQFGKRVYSDLRNFPSTAVQQVTKPRVKVPFGMGGGIGGLLGFEGLYGGVSGITEKLGMQPGMPKTVLDTGLTIAGMMNPYGRAIGLGLQGLKLARAVGSPVIDYFGQARGLKPGDTRKALEVDMGDPLFPNIFAPVDPTKIVSSRGAPYTEKRLAEEGKNIKEASEVALTGNTKPDVLVATGKEELGTGQNKSDVIDITKVASNNAVAPGSTIGNLNNLTQGPNPLVLGEIESKPKAPVSEPDKKKTAGQTDVNLQKDTNALDDSFKKSIAKARLIKEELMEGQTSNAKLVFLANLAQGLLTGTTRKQGVGGALEVFGNAIGPATTNYATMKLKENELENNLMSDALELVSEENKSRNQASKLPKIKQFGVIQVQDANNQARNIVGVQYENGTFGVATGQFDDFGREIFAPIAANQVNKFIEHSKGQSERDKTIRDLSGKYKAYQIGLTSINLLKQEDVTGGPVGQLSLYSKRLGDALSDFNIGFLSRDEGKAKIKELKDQYIQQYMKDNNVDQETATKVFEGQFGKGESFFRKTLDSLNVEFKGAGADLEQLAINETILTYALANSLKSKDRLTQKDIQMAAKLVNVFPFLRGEESVIEALEAVNNTLIKDIQASEFDYINAFGGDSRTIDNYRRRYGITGTAEAPTIKNPYADKTTKDLLKEY